MAHELTFYLIGALTVVAAVAAMSLRNLVHCALCAAGAFTGLAALYLQLDAEFVGFAQFLVYVGAIAVLIVFTVLLTHGADLGVGASRFSPLSLTGASVAALLLICLVACFVHSTRTAGAAEKAVAAAPIKNIGQELMSNYVLPLEALGLLLTVALLGAIVIAVNDKTSIRRTAPPASPARQTDKEAVLT